MKKIYEEKVSKLTSNYLEIRKQFIWENDLAKHLIALTYAMNEKDVDVDEIKYMQEYIKSNTGIFSSFRGTIGFALAGLLCASSKNAKQQFDFMIDNEKLLKQSGFKSSIYLPTALYALSSTHDGYDSRNQISKAVEIYKEMRNNHPFLTSGDDYALAILLANTDHDMNDIEKLYEELNNNGFYKSNGLQMLSHILAFSEKSRDETIKICVEAYEQLKKNRLKVSAAYYPAIGIMTLIPDEQGEFKNDVIDITNYLREQKKYKWLDKGMNVMIGASLIASEYIKEQTDKNVISTSLNVSIQAIIAAQQAAMIATIVAVSSTSSSSS